MNDLDRMYEKLVNERAANARLSETATNLAEIVANQYAKLKLLDAANARYEALTKHLPEGYAVGDDATATLALKLTEVEAANARLREALRDVLTDIQVLVSEHRPKESVTGKFLRSAKVKKNIVAAESALAEKEGR